MNTGVGYAVAPDQLVFLVDVDVILVTAVALAVLLAPAGILIFLSLHVGLMFPTLRRLAFLDLFVFIPRVAFLLYIDEARYGLTASRYQAGLPQPLVRKPEQFLDQTVTHQLLAERPQRLGIGYRVFRRQLQEALE